MGSVAMTVKTWEYSQQIHIFFFWGGGGVLVLVVDLSFSQLLLTFLNHNFDLWLDKNIILALRPNANY
jgi:hypothetical protein